MKGIVFTQFFEMVEQNFGFETVDKLLDTTQLETGGAYTAVGTYDYHELVALVQNLHRLTNIPIDDLTEAYGAYLFPKLIAIVPDLVAQFKDSFELMASVDSIIHVEVKKLYPDAELPKFDVVRRTDKELQLRYTSNRPFVHLARGLILSCAKHFNEQIEVIIHMEQDNNLITLKR